MNSLEMLSTTPKLNSSKGLLPALPDDFGFGVLSGVIGFLDNKTVNKHGIFNTENSKVTLVPVNEDGLIESFSEDEMSGIDGFLRDTSKKIKGFISKMVGQEYEESKWAEGSFSIDATSSIVKSFSKTPIKVPAETHKVFIDGAVLNPDEITITGHIDSKKLEQLIKLQEVDQWFLVLHTKQLGGTITSTSQVTGGEKKFFITNTSINDDGFKNTVLVTIKLQEVLLYKIAEGSGKYTLTNDESGNGDKSETQLGEKIDAEKLVGKPRED
jgi:hypothetical protein